MLACYAIVIRHGADLYDGHHSARSEHLSDFVGTGGYSKVSNNWISMLPQTCLMLTTPGNNPYILANYYWCLVLVNERERHRLDPELQKVMLDLFRSRQEWHFFVTVKEFFHLTLNSSNTDLPVSSLPSHLGTNTAFWLGVRVQLLVWDSYSATVNRRVCTEAVRLTSLPA